MESDLVCRSKPLPACSFTSSLHPEYDAINAECEPWILAFTSPASEAASHFWRSCAVPLLCSLAYAHCAAPRVVPLVKLLTWFFVSDTDDDDPSVRGCEIDHVALRHELILACYAGRPLRSGLDGIAKTGDDVNARIDHVAKGLPALHEIWSDILPHLPLGARQRYIDAIRDHLNANRLQAHFRKAGRLPGVEEYLYALRRPTSLVLPCLILIEYALGIELDDEIVNSEIMTSLHDAVTDHVALANDVMSCKAEECYEDCFNLPCVIRNERAAVQPGFTFSEAMREALSKVEEVDRRCVQLMKEAESAGLTEKPGVRAYLRGLELWMAGNVEWSLKTARYSHTCSAQGVVRVVPAFDSLI